MTFKENKETQNTATVGILQTSREMAAASPLAQMARRGWASVRGSRVAGAVPALQGFPLGQELFAGLRSYHRANQLLSEV